MFSPRRFCLLVARATPFRAKMILAIECQMHMRPCQIESLASSSTKNTDGFEDLQCPTETEGVAERQEMYTMRRTLGWRSLV